MFPLGKKTKKSAPVLGGPEVEALKPKPSINTLGQKRVIPPPPPSGSSSNASSSNQSANPSPQQPVKKPRLDFSTTATPPKPKVAAQSTSHLRPSLDEAHKAFCEKTEVEIDTFEETLEETCKANQFNKAVRMICAALRDVDKKREETGIFAFEEDICTAISKAVKEHGESLKNVNLSRSIFYLLCTSKGIAMDKQSLLVSWVTHLNGAQPNADPVVITSYLHDALGERCWIDKPHSLELVTRIIRYFGTRFPSRSMYSQCGSDVSTPDYIPDDSVTPLYFGGDDEELLKKTALDYLSKTWEFYGESPPRHLLRTMNAFAAFPEVRLQAAKKIDGWLQNAKLQRVALEVLLFLGSNIGDATQNEMDRETLGCLLKLRSYKSKMVTPVYAVMIKELLARNKTNLAIIVHLLLGNEFGHPQHRFHLNMQLFQSLFSIDNQNTTKIMGGELAAVISSREDNYKPARLFIRELVRSILRTDFLFSNFANSFMDHMVAVHKTHKESTPPHVSRLTVDTCTWLPLVAITQQVKDAFANRRANGNAAPSAMETINKFQGEMREYHRVVIQCLNALHPLMSRPEQEMDFPKAFYRMLFLDARDKPDSYALLETGTSDEIAKGIAVILECPINEKLICLIAKCSSLPKEERLVLIDKLINNAIMSRPVNDMVHPLMNITTLNVFETLFKMIDCKEGVTVESWLWRTWRICLLLLCATPPPPIFTLAYDSYPMLRMITKMILLDNFTFPLKLDGKSAEVIGAEFEKIREQEEDLSVSSDDSVEEVIQLCKFNPATSIRAPPRETATDLSQLAVFYRMSAQLSQLRSPDLLAKLIEEEGSIAAMPAIEAVVSENAGAHTFIPVPCLTQFLLHHLTRDEERQTIDETVIPQMGERVREAVGQAGEEGDGRECLSLLVTRLANGRRQEREAAVALLNYLLTPEMTFPLMGQPVPLDRLAASPFFHNRRTFVCFSIAEAFRVESDPARLDAYLRFITKHSEDDELHKLSVLLSYTSTRHDDSIRSSLIHFFARYVERSGESSVEEGVKMVYMHVNGNKVSLVSSTLFFILELLSRFRGGGEGRDRLLSLILSPAGALPTVTDTEGAKIELLNDQLRGAMLSSTDESIVKVALGHVDVSTSFNMICTFGLTTFSASNLLKNLDALDESTFDEIRNAQRAIPFVIAYRKRGAQGGERFLSLLTRSGQSSMKDEPMDECDSLVLLPPPRVEYEKSAQTTETPLLTKMELTKKLREMVTTTTFVLSSLEFRSAAASEANSDVCLEFLELNLKFFFSHVGAFNDMIQLLCAASDKYPSVRAKLRTLCAKVLKSAAVPPSIEDQIRKLAEGPAPAAAPAKNVAPTKKPLDLTCATAEDLLETLIKRKNMTSIERARIINRFVQLRPEIIDIQVNSAEIDRQIGRVFGVLWSEGVDRLVAQLWLRASPETIDCILKRIMKEYSQSISPPAVMELLRHCSASPSYLEGLSREELKVACTYMLEWATEEYPVHPSSLVLLTQFIHQLIPITGHSLLVDLASNCVSIDRSTAPRDRRVAAAALLEELQKRFPCLDVSSCSSNISIKKGTHDSLSSADKELTALLSVLFACKDDSEVASAIDSLTNIIHFNKSIVLRQLPVMSRLIARISENPSSQIKEFRRFRWIINFLISSMMDLMHCISADNIVDIDRLLDGLLDFYQKHVSNTRDEIELSKRLLDLILSYLTAHRTDARDFLSMIGGDRVSGMLQAVRADEQYEEIQRVIDAM